MKSYKFNGMVYKSRGELRIAKFLTEKKIKFVYEKKLVLKRPYDKGKESIFYPDFYIPKRKLIIEYFGMVGDSNYDSISKGKKEIYRHNRYGLISVYPDTPSSLWQREVLRKARSFFYSWLFRFIVFLFKVMVFVSVLSLLTFYLFDIDLNGWDGLISGSDVEQVGVICPYNLSKLVINGEYYVHTNVSVFESKPDCMDFCRGGDVVFVENSSYVKRYADLEEDYNKSNWFCVCSFGSKFGIFGYCNPLSNVSYS